ncbi:hypothetical protein [Priestia flexa]|uniref:hypothetical protein n=1 Tax=Priestia flexa TaxID=86664 RepID=UPI002490DE01|nr:hypothetical protein [Priestia flexa]
MNLKTADFRHHLEEYEEVLAANRFHVYHCTHCDCEFAVSQNIQDQSDIMCPICLKDTFVIDLGTGIMMKKGE